MRACHLSTGDLHCGLHQGHDGPHGAFLGVCAGEGSRTGGWCDPKHEKGPTHERVGSYEGLAV